MILDTSFTIVLDHNALVIYFNNNNDYTVETITSGKHTLSPRGYNQVFLLDSTRKFACLSDLRNTLDTTDVPSDSSGIDLDTSALFFKNLFSSPQASSPQASSKPDIEIV